jgi:hypothetical protein
MDKSKVCLISEMRVSPGVPYHIPDGGILCISKAIQCDYFSFHDIVDVPHFKNYDVVIVELKPGKLFSLAQKLVDITKVVGLIEGSLSTVSGWEPAQQIEFYDILNKVDAVGCLVKGSESLYEAFTPKPVRYFPIPYSTTYVKSKIISPEKKSHIIEVGSSLSLNRNGIASLLTLKNGFTYDKTVVTAVNTEDYSAIKHLDVPKMDILMGWESWLSYLDKKKYYYVGIHLDSLTTCGRFSIDSGALGIPCISTFNNSHPILFPELVVDYWDVKKARELLHRLLEDKDFYNHCRNYALEKVELFSEESAAKIIRKIISEVVHGL